MAESLHRRSRVHRCLARRDLQQLPQLTAEVNRPPYFATERWQSLQALPHAIHAAKQMLDEGRSEDAARLLGLHLGGIQLTTAPDDPVLIDACILYAPLTHRSPLVIARYAHAAARRLHHEHHPRLLAATRMLAAVLHRLGECAESITLRHSLVTACEQLGLHHDELMIRAAAADCLHASGRCEAAADAIGAAWVAWRLRPDPHGQGLTGETILRTYVRILDGCRRQAELAALRDDVHLTPLAALADQHTFHRRAAAEHISRHRPICGYRYRPAGHAEAKQRW